MLLTIEGQEIVCEKVFFAAIEYPGPPLSRGSMKTW